MSPVICDHMYKITKSFILSSCRAVESADCYEDYNTKSRLSSEVIVVQIEVHCLRHQTVYLFILESK